MWVSRNKFMELEGRVAELERIAHQVQPPNELDAIKGAFANIIEASSCQVNQPNKLKK